VVEGIKIQDGSVESWMKSKTMMDSSGFSAAVLRVMRKLPVGCCVIESCVVGVAW